MSQNATVEVIDSSYGPPSTEGQRWDHAHSFTWALRSSALFSSLQQKTMVFWHKWSQLPLPRRISGRLSLSIPSHSKVYSLPRRQNCTGWRIMLKKGYQTRKFHQNCLIYIYIYLSLDLLNKASRNWNLDTNSEPSWMTSSLVKQNFEPPTPSVAWI